MLTTIITILATLIPTILTNRGIIGTGTDNLITALVSPLEQLFTALKGGANGTTAALAALAAASAVIQALKANTSLPAALLTTLAGFEADIAAALAAYAKAGGGLDLTVYTITAEV